MENNRKLFWTRALIGGLCGLALMFLFAFWIELASAQIRGTFHFPVLVTHSAQHLFGSYPLAVAVQSLLCFALGSMVGIATLPFDEDGRKLVRNSLIHFAGTAFFYSLLLVLCLGLPVWSLPVWLGILAALYVVIWLGRYVGWYVEVCQIRVKLGLDPGPSVLKWKETLPYLPFLVLLCIGLPLLARLLDPADVPVFSQLVVPFLVLPAGSFAAGMSLGKRQGFCPLYPVLTFVLYLPIVCLLLNASDVFYGFPIGGLALAGNYAGSLKHWAKQRSM